MNDLSILQRARQELRRLFSNFKYERDPATGVVRFANGIFIGGHLEDWKNGGQHQISPNLVTDEGLNHLLTAGVGGTGAVSDWFIAPYSNNAAPTASLTLANFHSTLAEVTAYDELTRQAWVDVAGAKLRTNSASPATITINAAGTNIRGIGVMSSATKTPGAGSATGVLLAAIPLATARLDMQDDDLLNFIYTLSVADDGV